MPTKNYPETAAVLREWHSSEEALITLAEGMEPEEDEGLATDDGLIIPDFLLQPRSTTILYTIDNKLYTAKGNVIHLDMEFQIIKHDKNFARFFDQIRALGVREKRMFLQKYAALYGRAGVPPRDDERFVVSFWNEEPEIYDKLLESCLSTLETKGILPDDVPIEIHTPLDISGYEAEAGETKRQRGTTPEQQRRYELQRRMHLATGAEKQEIRKELGLWTNKKAQHPWQVGLEKAGELSPGRKWWAPQSEQIEQIAQAIDEAI